MPPSKANSASGIGGRPTLKVSSTRSGAGGGTLRQRKGGTVTTSRSRASAGGSGGVWRFYSDDSPGIKVGPVPVLVMSLLFIASVFMLHIWGKYTRA